VGVDIYCTSLHQIVESRAIIDQMTGLNHVLTGAAIGMGLQNPWLVAPAALVSHFILDSIPHFDHEAYRYGSRYFARIMASDAVLSICSVLALAVLLPHVAIAIIIGAVFAVLPDSFWLYYYRKGRPQTWFFRFHTKIQWFERPIGALVEASYLIFICVTLVALNQSTI
jgi:hypothetical protein